MTKAKKEPRKEFDVVAQTLMIPVALLDESELCAALDAMKAVKKAIFGKGYLISEKAAAEKAAAHKWELSDRERAIVKKLCTK